MAEITQEQREKLFERAEFRLRLLNAPLKFAERSPDSDAAHRTEQAAEEAGDFRELLRLARLATPELVALGERAKEWAERTGRGKTTIVERDRLLSAARLYAQSIKGEDHGK